MCRWMAGECWSLLLLLLVRSPRAGSAFQDCPGCCWDLEEWKRHYSKDVVAKGLAHRNRIRSCWAGIESPALLFTKIIGREP